MGNVVLELVREPSPELSALIDELDAELAGPYDPDQHHGFSLESIFLSGMVLFVARIDGVAAGCGGVAFDDGFAELKRMYVRPGVRGRGVAQAILARLEAEARARDCRRLTLETGDVQHAAMRVYERAGFVRCEPFGSYLTLAPHAIERSVFFEKWI